MKFSLYFLPKRFRISFQCVYCYFNLKCRIYQIFKTNLWFFSLLKILFLVRILLVFRFTKLYTYYVFKTNFIYLAALEKTQVKNYAQYIFGKMFFNAIMKSQTITYNVVNRFPNQTASKLRGSVHFDRSALFQFFLSW